MPTDDDKPEEAGTALTILIVIALLLEVVAIIQLLYMFVRFVIL